MFDSKREREATVTLCIFPHLREFLAVDVRPSLPNRPTFRVLSFGEVHGKDFLEGVEGDFSKLLRRPDQNVMGLMALPQEVEALVRTHSLRRVMEVLNSDVPDKANSGISSVGVMFFAGNLLTVSNEQLREVVKDIFGDNMTPGQIGNLYDRVSELLIQERHAVSTASRSELAKLISGEDGPYMTIWNRENS